MSGRKTGNPAQLRGDIAAGRAGGKRPGFDPAAVPLETDSEAGGMALDGLSVETARRTQAHKGNPEPARERVDEITYGTAMRRTRPQSRAWKAAPLLMWLVVGAGILALLAVVLAAIG